MLLISGPFTGVFVCKPQNTKGISLLGTAVLALLNKHMVLRQPQPRLKRLEGITDDFAVWRSFLIISIVQVLIPEADAIRVFLRLKTLAVERESLR